jgi:hypothetical protein
MDYTYEDVKHKTVAQLRDIAKDIDHEAVKGYTQLHKDQLIAAICTALGIEMHVHHEVVGIDKTAIKARIRRLKAERDEALAARDRKKLKPILRRIHRMKRQIHKATV